MTEIEFEKTYLAKYLPDEIKNTPVREIIDIYLPYENAHPKLRIRKNGTKYFLTKKEQLNNNDASAHHEHTIILTEQEFSELQTVHGKRIRKLRYSFTYNSIRCEVDVFQDALKGLVLVDFEFSSQGELHSFSMPEFCLADVTKEDAIAGGMLAGKSYADIETFLNTYHYNKL